MNAPHEKYRRLIEAAKALPPLATAVAHPCDESALSGVVHAARMGPIEPMLVGEHAASICERVSRQTRWLGVDLDAQANAEHGPRISTAASRTAAWVIPTNEELMIARHTRALLASQPP